MVKEKIIDKLRKLRAHADSAKDIGNEAEAEAFAAMFQKLLLRHKLSATDLELAAEEKDQPIGQHEVDWTALRYTTAQGNNTMPWIEAMINGSRRIGWVEALAAVIAKAFFCRILVQQRSTRIWLVGRPSDTEIAEYMLVTLVRSARKICFSEHAKFRKANPHADMKGFRASFLDHFVRRLAERFDEERRRATVEAPSESTALMRINTAESAVAQYMASLHTRTVNATGHRKNFNRHGARRGREVANDMNLRANAVKSGTAPKSLEG